MRKILVLGATSAIGQATCRLFAKDGDWLYLVARDPIKLQAVADDLKVYGAGKIETAVADLDQTELHPALFNKADELFSGVDMVFVAYGSLGDQKACQMDYAYAEKILRNNFLSVVSFLTVAANALEGRKAGMIVVISSVAGDRGRKRNYIYGCAKGALSIFLQGLRNRLAGSGVHVLTIKPGFVDTPMTAHLKKTPLFAKPDPVAQTIYKAIVKKKEILYVPWFWYEIIQGLNFIPERIFKKTNL